MAGENKFELDGRFLPSSERVETRRSRKCEQHFRLLSINQELFLVVKLLRAHDGCLGIGRR